jgi:2',3'-cyclic-nucleotide 2'-phosphodiesterase (5'-nucleotidase family)
MTNRFGPLCALVLLALFSHHGIVRGDELTVVYTANSSGKLTACNCPTDPYGGLAERTTLIRDLRRTEEPFLLVDAGNMVSLFGAYGAKAECVMRLMNKMKYDAAGLGCNELFQGLERTRDMSAAADFTLTSAVFARKGKSGEKSEEHPAFKPYVIAEIGGNKVGIVSVCDSTSQTRLGSPRVDDYRFLPYQDALRSALSEIAPSCDFTVVLSNLTPAQNQALTDEFPVIDLIIEGYGNRKYDPPIETPSGIIVSPGTRGQFVGLITIVKSDSGKISIGRHEQFGVLNIPEADDARAIVADYLNNLN